MSIANTARTIELIPHIEVIEKTIDTATRKERVAAYARVSTESEDQLQSYDRQCEYYNKKLGNDSSIIYIGLYADPGLTGTKMRKRPHFLDMIKDCRAGKIDRIITKSVQRFARNTVECLQIAHELADMGVYIKFETLGIDTKNPKSWGMLAIMASQAEEESRTTSHNISWTIQKKFERGEYCGGRVYGYDTKKNFKIIKKEAMVVKRIFDEFLSGMSLNDIKRGLERDGIKPPYKKKQFWYIGTLKSMLQNEKYMGDLLLQKTYKTDLLCERKINKGERTMYRVHSHHPGIVTKEQFSAVQQELERRGKAAEQTEVAYSNDYAFSSLVECAECGARFRRHAQWSVDYSKKVPIWVCTTHQKHHDRCSQKPVKEIALEQGFMDALVRLCSGRDEVLSRVRENIHTILNSEQVAHAEDLFASIKAKQGELVQVSKIANPTDAEKQRSSQLIEEIQDLKEMVAIAKRKSNDINLLNYRIQEIEQVLTGGFSVFDKSICKTLLEKVIINDKHQATYVFKCGIAIDQEI